MDVINLMNDGTVAANLIGFGATIKMIPKPNSNVCDHRHCQQNYPKNEPKRAAASHGMPKRARGVPTPAEARVQFLSTDPKIETGRDVLKLMIYFRQKL